MNSVKEWTKYKSLMVKENYYIRIWKPNEKIFKLSKNSYSRNLFSHLASKAREISKYIERENETLIFPFIY